MDTEKPNIIMHKPKKPLLSKFNECLTCKLCKGYIIDATTIIECSHSFCRSCIVKYLESNKYCPSCDVQVHKTRPLLNIRPDKILQNLVYKLVPRLYHNEIKKRTLYYETHPSAKISIFEKNMLAQYEYILSPDELVDISLHYYGCSTSLRFIRCSCAVTVSHIIRLINAKYDLTDQHKVEVLYDQDILNSSNSLMEIAYIYSWKKDSPLDLAYKIYENRIKKPRLEHSDNDVDSFVSRNNNNWKEVQLRISETGEMSITGIQDANLLEMLNNEAKFNNEVVINEGKNLEDDEIKKNTQLLKDAETKSTNKTDIEVIKKEIPDLKLISEISSIKNSNKTNNSMGHLSITKVSSTPNLNLISSSISTTISKIGKLSSSLPASKTMELSEALNLNSELSVIPLNANSSCVSLSSCGTTTVYSTINKTMCSTKSDDNNYRESSNVNNISEIKDLTMTTILKQSNCLKRKCEDIEKSSPISSKLPKPTILNHTIGLINLSNHHPLKKHLKLNKNGDRRQTDVTVTSSVHSPTTTVSSDPNKYTIIKRSFTPVNKKLGQSTKGLPCYMLKSQSSVKNTEKNGEKMETNQQQKPEQISQTKSQHLHHVHHHTPIITPSQLPHHQNSSQMMRQTTKETGTAEKQNQENHTKNEPSTTTTTITSETNHQSSNISDVISTVSTNNSLLMPTAKSKSNTHHHSLGYKTLRDPPKSWNAQINSQIARDKRNVKAQQLVLCEANNAAAAAAGGKSAGDLKNVRPAKFFKGRQVPRYLGNPASGVKPLYQLYSNPEKDKPMQDASANVVKPLEKSEIKKHSIVNVDPKTLKPISEKAPETLNLSNLSSSSSSSVHLTSTTLELRINPTMMSDLKINTSSVSIFNPLKLQQNSPKNERRSPKSPHSPKIKAIANASTVSTSSSSSSSSLTPATTTTINTLSPKQQRDKTSLTFTPSNPFIPNLASPTLNPNQFIYPAGGFPSYDPRVMAAYHHIWYSQRIAAAGLTNLPPGLTGTHPFGLNMALNSPTSMASPSSSSSSQQQISPGVSSKHSAAKSPSSPRTSSGSSPQQSKSSSVTKKLKDSPTATANNKSDKSLESALEKITKVNKELEEKNKELKIELKKESLNENSGADNRRNSTNKSSKLELLKDSISETEKKTVEKTVDECKEKSETVCCSDEKKCEEVKIDTVNGITIEVPQENGKENVDNVEKLVSEEKSLEVPIKECKDNNLTDSKDEEISLEKKSEPVTLPELDEEEKRESPENLSSENVKVTENVTDESVHELPVINIDDKISPPVNNKNSTTKEEEEEKEKEVKIDEKVVEISSTAESKNNKSEELKENLESLETENVDAESVSS